MGNHVLDSRRAKVADYLRRNLAGATQFGVVPATSACTATSC